MHPVDAPIGHLNNFSTNYAVVLRCDAAQASPMAVWIAIRLGFRRKNALIGTRFLV